MATGTVKNNIPDLTETQSVLSPGFFGIVTGLVRKRVLRCHFILKTIFLPRQARDKHRKNTFLQANFVPVFGGPIAALLPLPVHAPANRIDRYTMRCLFIRKSRRKTGLNSL